MQNLGSVNELLLHLLHDNNTRGVCLKVLSTPVSLRRQIQVQMKILNCNEYSFSSCVSDAVYTTIGSIWKTLLSKQNESHLQPARF